MDSGNQETQETFDPFSIKMVLPMVIVGTFILAISFLFCCCLTRLRKRGPKVCGYRKVTLNKRKDNPLEETKNDICPVCLCEFKNKEVLAICPCSHVFHKKCLCKWLEVRLVCPICLAQVQVSKHHDTINTVGTSFALSSNAGNATGIFPSQV